MSLNSNRLKYTFTIQHSVNQSHVGRMEKGKLVSTSELTVINDHSTDAIITETSQDCKTTLRITWVTKVSLRLVMLAKFLNSASASVSGFSHNLVLSWS